MYKYFLFALLVFTGCVSSIGQTHTTRKTTSPKALALYKTGNEYSRNNLFDKAINEYNKALKKDPNFIDAHIKMAGVYYEQKKFAEAKSQFAKATQLAPNYQPRIYLTLGVIAQKEQQYDEAIAQIQKYLSYPDIKPKRKANAEKRLADVRFMKDAYQNPLSFRPTNLGPAINTHEPEYLPSFTADEQFMIFTRRVAGQEDFFVSKKADNQWQKGSPMTSINTDKNEGAQCISADGRQLAMTLCGSRNQSIGSCDIYFSHKTDGRWSEVTNIGQPVNSPYWDAQPSLSANGQSIYFASERPGGHGKRDIWVSHRNKNGQWKEPTNLGESINTDGHDQAPYIHPDGQTLYFMSDGHPGMGGSDLYLSRMQPDSTWGKAQNLGYPINDTGNQGALVVSLDGQTGYFAGPEQSAQEGGYFGGTIDIFQFNVPKSIQPIPTTYVQAIIKDAETGQTIVAEVEMISLSDGHTVYQGNTASSGRFLACLPIGKNYALNISKEGYLFHSGHFKLDSIKSINEPFIIQVNMQKIKKAAEAVDTPVTSEPIILKNVFFDSGSAVLRPESHFELDKLADLLATHRDLAIQIKGHTDNVGAESDNLILSKNRAKAVHDYLKSKGIINTIQYEGYGESQPIDTNETPAGRANNRRTEFMML